MFLFQTSIIRLAVVVLVEVNRNRRCFWRSMAGNSLWPWASATALIVVGVRFATSKKWALWMGLAICTELVMTLVLELLWSYSTIPFIKQNRTWATCAALVGKADMVE